jgi:uroporphyrinogen-III synthase
MTTSTTILRVCSFESRRQAEMAELLNRQGATAFVAPSMREVPLEDNPDAFQFADHLFAGRIDTMVFLTGVGARALMSVLETRFTLADVLAALARCRIAVRGPKPAAVLREWKLRIDLKAPEPNTWRELVRTLDEDSTPLAGQTVAVQEYGEQNLELHAALRQRGAEVLSVPVYRWALPEDVGPLEAAVRRTVAGEFDVLMITSAQQVRHAVAIAEQIGCRDEFLNAARNCVLASVGPTSSEALQQFGLTADFEPSHPKMGSLVRELCRQAGELLSKKGRS